VQFVLTRLLFQHNLWLVALAALICGLACLAGFSLLTHARGVKGPMRYVWLGVAALSVGSGIWSTHFVAMLAFSVGFPVEYQIGTTVLSLLVAIVITGGAMGFAAAGKGRYDALLSGAVIGLGITCMHYVGMAALMVGGLVKWNWSLVVSSAAIAMVLGALAVETGRRGPQLRWRFAGAGLLTVAICAMHFTGMGAADFSSCFSIVDSEQATPVVLSLGVGIGSILIIGLALGALRLDVMDKRRTQLEAERMRGLADAAVEGLVLCDGDRIVAVNSSMERMTGLDQTSLVGRDLQQLLAEEACEALRDTPDVSVETLLASARGLLPVEAIMRPVDYKGRPHCAVAIRDLSARKEAEQRIRFLAHHDSLTKIANRGSFNERLEDELEIARRDGSNVGLLVLDLDRFKEVNDLFGHASGDSLLQRVADVLQHAVKPPQLAARLGGDEFAILLPHMASRAAAEDVAGRVLKLFHRDNATAPEGVPISASIGVAVFPDDAEDADRLMKHADAALYRAKEDGRGNYRMYEPAMGDAVRDRLRLERDLRLATSHDQMRLVYQPQVDIQSGEVTGFEALLRWEHPERGSVSPGVFIPIAEETGSIIGLGEWVMRTACEEAARWVSPLTIAINVSPVQLYAEGFAATVFDVLIRSRLAPSRLELEITETALVRDMNRALTTLRQIKAFGVRIAMDDFGTGYSSLSNLRAFPFDKIKIDQSFIRSVDSNPQSAAIVRAVLGLGRGLDLPVIAEGVERTEELEFLRGETCAEIQGYLVSKPTAIEDFAAITSGRRTTLAPGEPADLKRAG